MISNQIDHITLVLDASSSMTNHSGSLVRVVDNLVAHLARQSKEQEREVRVTVYTFADRGTVKCLVWDKDALRMPSINGLYVARGNTALIDATLMALRDMATIPQKYGDHAFLTYVLTDGEENDSREGGQVLQTMLKSRPDNCTEALLVPDAQGVFNAKRIGIPAGNITIWDTTSKTGAEEAVRTIQQATDSYMTSRATGVYRGTSNLFGGAAQVNTATVQAAGLKPVDPNTYKLIPVIPSDGVKNYKGEIEISTYVKSVNNGLYRVGSVYYPLVPGMRPPKIAPQKGVAVLDKKANLLYSGPQARQMLGLPTTGTVAVKPDANPEWTVYVQSTSPNRYLTPHSQILMFN